jgi:hypothetical protein
MTVDINVEAAHEQAGQVRTSTSVGTDMCVDCTTRFFYVPVGR